MNHLRLVVLAVVLGCAGAVQAADAGGGKALFDRTCANCHSVEAGVNKVGPTLFDVVDRPIASVPGYDYSKKMRAVGKDWKVWNEKRLGDYLIHVVVLVGRQASYKVNVRPRIGQSFVFRVKLRIFRSRDRIVGVSFGSRKLVYYARFVVLLPR